MPMTSQPGSDAARVNGFGDIVTTAFLSPSAPSRVIWGVGPAFLLPSATNNALGSEKFGIGPSVVVLTQPARWTLGFLMNHIWSVSGANDRSDMNQTFLQPFANYNLGNGVAAGVTMEASANWEADERWTAPLLFSINKVTTFGKRPVNLSVAAGPTVAGPDGGASWRFRLVATFLFPR